MEPLPPNSMILLACNPGKGRSKPILFPKTSVVLF